MEVSSLHNTVVLVFALTAKEEMSYKGIAKGTALFEELTAHTLRAVRKTGIPFIHINEDAQKGTNFGERFTCAIQQAFDQGYTNVITIGNDTPELSVSHILEAQRRLQENQLVLGPSKDGGFYLMGLSKSHFDRKTFVTLPWQTARLNSALLAIVSTLNVKTHKLPVLFDIDSTADLEQCLQGANRIPKAIMQLVFCVLASKKALTQFVVNENYSFLGKNPSHNRGSPVHF